MGTAKAEATKVIRTNVVENFMMIDDSLKRIERRGGNKATETHNHTTHKSLNHPSTPELKDTHRPAPEKRK